MKHEQMDRQLDAWLDRAAVEYGRAETRPGFETRIIANVNRRAAARKQRIRRLAIAATATAVLVFSFWAILNRPLDRDPGVDTSQKPGIPDPVREQSSDNPLIATAKTAESIVKRNIYVSSIPKQRVAEVSYNRGLLSGPISEEEHLLIAYVQSISIESEIETPEENAFQPLEIPETEIPPLTIRKLKVTSISIEPLEIKTNKSEVKS